MTRLSSIIFAGLVALGLVPARAATAEKPNRVFIMLGEMGPADAGCYGSQVIRTPNIDRLAAQGMRYDFKRPEGGVSTRNPQTGGEYVFSAYRIFAEMKDFIRANKDRPFLCYAPWTMPHPRAIRRGVKPVPHRPQAGSYSRRA